MVEGGRVHCPEASLKHYGYGLGAEAMRKKIQRSIGLLDLMIKEGHLKSLYYRAQQKGMAGDKQGALADLEAYHRGCMKQGRVFQPDAFYSIITTNLALQRLDRATDWLARALNEAPELPDIQFLRSEIGFMRGDSVECLKGATKYLGLVRRLDERPNGCFNYLAGDEHRAVALYRVICLRGSELLDCLGALKELMPRLPLALTGQISGDIRERLARIKALDLDQLEAAA
jgi:tetratricopeptide (TPR) repeat protein